MLEKNIHVIGCGYIGKKIALRLLEKNIAPRCYVYSENSKSQCDALNLQTCLFDLDNAAFTFSDRQDKGLENSELVYLVPPSRSGVVDERMGQFVAFLETLHKPPGKILLISTTGVYGDCNGDWIDESRPVNPQADRARRRLSAETQLEKYCEDQQVHLMVFRVPGIYAQDKLPLKRIASGEAIVNAADSGFTNRIHADDLAAFCVEALIENIDSGVYNCCDGHPSTMNDYFMKVADAMKLDRPGEISLQQAQQTLSPGMLSYLAESKRISNKKLLSNFKTRFIYNDLTAGLENINLQNLNTGNLNE